MFYNINIYTISPIFRLFFYSNYYFCYKFISRPLHMNQSTNKTVLKTLITIFFIPTLVSLLIFIFFILEKGLDLNFNKAGIYPRKIEYLWTIFSHIFVHANWSHLFNNIISLEVLGCFLFYFYRPGNFTIYVFLWVCSGLILWIIGRENRHIGVSGLIYAIASFLFISGLIHRHIPLIAIALIVTLFYGNIIWHIFPWQANDPVSWEGHLSGLISGVFASIIFRKSGPQKPEVIWDENDDDDDDDEFNDNDDQIDFENNENNFYRKDYSN